MNPAARNRTPVRWPFWLLIVAWVCANSPQVATYALITWLGEARHFNHQQHLTLEVAYVLTGKPVPGLLAAMQAAPVRSPVPLVPAGATLKKIELAVEITAEMLPPALRERLRVARATSLPEPRREAPPHEPPRVGMLLG